MKKQFLFLITAFLSLSFYSCKEDFSVSDEIEISTSQQSLDKNYSTLNNIVSQIEAQPLREVHQRFPNAGNPFIQVAVAKSTTTHNFNGTTKSKSNLKVKLSMKYDESKAEEAVEILQFYKSSYIQYLIKYKVPVMEKENLVFND